MLNIIKEHFIQIRLFEKKNEIVLYLNGIIRTRGRKQNKKLSFLFKFT